MLDAEVCPCVPFQSKSGVWKETRQLQFICAHIPPQNFVDSNEMHTFLPKGIRSDKLQHMELRDMKYSQL